MTQSQSSLYQICFYAPESHVEEIKNALFAVGAGQYGNYDSCSWQCSGQGQFRPRVGSSPYKGEQGEIERVTEVKVEMLCQGSVLKEALAELKRTHPYEEPAYHILPILTNPPQGS